MRSPPRWHKVRILMDMVYRMSERKKKLSKTERHDDFLWYGYAHLKLLGGFG